MIGPFMTGPYLFYLNKAIDSLGESKSDWEVACLLAPRLGISGFNDKAPEAYLRELVAQTPALPDYEAFKKEGVHRLKLERPYVAFREQIENPQRHPFPTSSGKIEIYSQQLADRNDPLLPPIPKYIPTWEGPQDPLAHRYPLQLISIHSRRRVNSSFDNIPWLAELEPKTLELNPQDASSRGIRHGDRVRAFNERGQVLVQARVTERIMPGVVCLPQGGWYNPDEQGVDRGGCVNVLTRDEMTPGGAFPDNTTLVQVAKA